MTSFFLFSPSSFKIVPVPCLYWPQSSLIIYPHHLFIKLLPPCSHHHSASLKLSLPCLTHTPGYRKSLFPLYDLVTFFFCAACCFYGDLNYTIFLPWTSFVFQFSKNGKGNICFSGWTRVLALAQTSVLSLLSFVSCAVAECFFIRCGAHTSDSCHT